MENIAIEESYSSFNPRDYLQEYYSHIGSENNNLLAFYAEFYKKISKQSLLLEFSGGPTIYSLISAAGKVKEIHFCDYLKSNRDEIKLWKRNSKKAFNWDTYFERALTLEGNKNISKNSITSRKKELRIKLRKIIRGNAFKNDPIHPTYRNKYDIISVNFVLESVTDSVEEWEQTIVNVTSMLKSGGTLIMTALKNANFYKVGNKSFPAVNISEIKVKKTFSKLGFNTIYLTTFPAEELDENSPEYEGYKGFIFMVVKKTT